MSVIELCAGEIQYLYKNISKYKNGLLWTMMATMADDLH